MVNPYLIGGSLLLVIAAFLFGYRTGGNSKQVAWDKDKLADMTISMQITKGNADRLVWAHKHADEVMAHVYEQVATLNDRYDGAIRRIAALGMHHDTPPKGPGLPPANGDREAGHSAPTPDYVLDGTLRDLAGCSRDYAEAATKLEAIAHLQ